MTYQDFFKLNDTPFRLTPDVDYFFPSESHGAALETLIYSIRSGEGFVQITGQPGVGKTILVRHLLNQLGGEVKTALILHPRLAPDDLLKVILEDLGVPAEVMQGNTKEGLLRFFRGHLLAAGREGNTTVVIVDEAQEIPDDTLEELRLLSNLETEKKKLLSIILVGQTELEDKLNKPSLKQLHQRITIRYRIEPFTMKETLAYILHRLSVAGATGNVHFSDRVLRKIHRQSAGIPRRINIICERALMAACVEGVKIIKNSHLDSALESYLGTSPGNKWQRFAMGGAAVALAVVVFWSVWWLFPSGNRFAMAPDGARPSALKEKGTQQEMVAAKATAASKVEAEASQLSSVQKTVSDGTTVTESLFEAIPAAALPRDWICLVLNRQVNQGEVWQSDGKTLNRSGTYHVNSVALRDGIYLLGESKDHQPVLFNQQQFTPWDHQAALAEQLWHQFGAGRAQPTIPLIVWSGKDRTWQAHFKENVDSITNLVRGWAHAWRSLDIDAYIQYYTPTHFYYPSIGKKPTALPRDKYYQRKGWNFRKNNYIALQISEPICIINPADSMTAMAIFSQRYASARYVDEGVKILLLRKIKEHDNAPLTWKIEGRCWMPMPQEKRGKEAVES